MFRRLLALLTIASLVLCLAFAVLRARSADATDVLMLAAPGGKCLLLSSHLGKWIQVTGLGDWPDAGVELWSAQQRYSTTTLPGVGTANHSWNRAGPFLFWQNHTSSKTAEVWYVRGRVAVPTDDGGKMPAYGDGYARADAANAWRGVIPGTAGVALP